MSDKIKLYLLYATVFIFLLINAVAFVNDWYFLLALPVVLVLMYLFVFAFDTLLLIVVFFTPLSINSFNFFNGLGLSMPTEPLMAGMMILFVLKLVVERNYDKAILKHPVTLAILFNLFWMLVTTVTSHDIFISAKFLTARLWFVTCFYFIAIYLFRKYKNIKAFFWCYIIPLAGVMVYTILHHAQYNFAEKPGHWVMSPFFNDHTAYGAAMAFFMPILAYLTFADKTLKRVKVFAFALLLLFVLALTLSFCRAAWVGVIVAFVAFVIFQFKINYKWVIATVFVFIGAFLINQSQIIDSMSSNKQESSGNIFEHAQSISNISTDASNVERINRWQSAFLMCIDEPLFGFGPGTYQFYYGPYQLSKNKTIISTNAGNMGTAHSEYFLPLSESGFLGMLSFLLILVAVFATFIRLFYRVEYRKHHFLVLAVFAGLITYWVHAALNNFLDTDKAAVPFWGFIAILVSLELYYKEQDNEG